jgi:hypothetical protein
MKKRVDRNKIETDDQNNMNAFCLQSKINQFKLRSICAQEEAFIK